MRRCKKCGETKPFDAFPPYIVAGKHGIRHTCRVCWNAKWSPIICEHQNRYYDENRNGLRDRVKARSKEAYRSGPELFFKRVKEYEERYPAKTAARLAVTMAVRSGRLTRQPCVVCGAEKTDAHHEDYSKPLEVIWLCRSCHGDRHRMLNRRSPGESQRVA